MTSEGQSRLRGLASAIKDARVHREPAREAGLPDLSDPNALYYFDARVYRGPAREAGLPDLSDPNALYYFAGFFSGEGCFMLAPPRGARFVIKLRRDDRPLLEAIRSRFQLGSVTDVSTPEPWSPAAAWHVTSARDVLRGITLFLSYIDVLRAWAVSVDGTLGCTAYEAARTRHRHWPRRDTIAFAFGGWYQALEAAGLEDRAVRRPSARQLCVELDRVHGRQGQ